MPQKGPVTIIAVLCFAFFWGYSKDSVRSSWARWQSSREAPPPAVEVPPEVPAGTLVPPPNQPRPPVPVVNPAPINRPPQMGVPTQAPSPGAALSNTLDSIRPGQIEPQQITQRNAYFEKLSQQLRELQGGGNPNAPPGSAPPPAEPPAPPGMIPPLPPGYPDANNMQPQPGAFDSRVGLEQVTPEADGNEADDATDADDEPDEPEE